MNNEQHVTEEVENNKEALEAHQTNEETSEEVRPIAEEQALPVSTIKWDDLIPSMSTSNSRGTVGSGALTIIHSKKNGKRVSLGREVLENLHHPEYVKVAFTDQAVIVMEGSPDDEQAFVLRSSGKKGVIYSTHLVEEITELFELNFSEKVSHTCYDVSYELLDGQPIANIPME